MSFSLPPTWQKPEITYSTYICTREHISQWTLTFAIYGHFFLRWRRWTTSPTQHELAEAFTDNVNHIHSPSLNSIVHECVFAQKYFLHKTHGHLHSLTLIEKYCTYRCVAQKYFLPKKHGHLHLLSLKNMGIYTHSHWEILYIWICVAQKYFLAQKYSLHKEEK